MLINDYGIILAGIFIKINGALKKKLLVSYNSRFQ